MTKERINLKRWVNGGETIVLEYTDGSTVKVKKDDFTRAFGAIINATKEEVVRDFAI